MGNKKTACVPFVEVCCRDVGRGQPQADVSVSEAVSQTRVQVGCHLGPG